MKAWRSQWRQKGTERHRNLMFPVEESKCDDKYVPDCITTDSLPYELDHCILYHKCYNLIASPSTWSAKISVRSDMAGRCVPHRRESPPERINASPWEFSFSRYRVPYQGSRWYQASSLHTLGASVSHHQLKQQVALISHSHQSWISQPPETGDI